MDGKQCYTISPSLLLLLITLLEEKGLVVLWVPLLTIDSCYCALPEQRRNPRFPAFVGFVVPRTFKVEDVSFRLMRQPKHEPLVLKVVDTAIFKELYAVNVCESFG